MNGIIDVTNAKELINIKDIEGSLLVSSREVATNFEKRHADVIKVIDSKISENEKLRSQKYFIENTYKVEGNNKTYKEYLMTRDGFSFLVMGFNGAKADGWKLKYIEAFNKMEQQIKNPYANMSKELQAILMVDKKQQEQEKRISDIENKMTVNYELAENLRSSINYRAVELLGGKDSEAYKKLNKKLFSSFYRDIKRTFKVNSYKNISVKNYDKAMRFIESWEPKDEVLIYAIQGLNSQLAFV